ncbi:DUF4145 domain-containing protein [Mycobacterium shigaense]|uniref:DUF4145 domain-containing protein n=1 Tax=Mycobacterium shigaense TaxID=722731 RepID=A0A1Z4EKD2_9MYCO|nr:DUF4145 domain-containing protein [Mycobacterium shigaense]BAX93429.1 hypothetical protein MSG_03292 [Mycobacterium shigaense]
MLNHICWICKANTGHELVGDARFVGPEAGFQPEQLACAAYECSVCGGISVALAAFGTPPHVPLYQYMASVRGDQLMWRPSATETADYPHVPPHIAEAAKEAYECESNQHYRAAIMLARAVIEATAKDKGVEDGTLYNKIEVMATAGLIRTMIKDAAHGVRELGNEMAHGDFVDPISAEESQLVIHLMGEILNDVYQSPAATAQAQQSAQARRQGRNS